MGIYFIINNCLLLNDFVKTFSTCMFCFLHSDHLMVSRDFIDYVALVFTWVGQNLKETLFLGNITRSETWKENIQGVFGFIWDKVGFCCKKREERVLKVFHR